MLIQIDDPEKREYYELESVNNGWTARETERQINSQFYERLLLNNDKEAVMAVARKERIPQTPQEIKPSISNEETERLSKNRGFH